MPNTTIYMKGPDFSGQVAVPTVTMLPIPPNLTLGLGQTLDMSQYISDPAGLVTSTRVLAGGSPLPVPWFVSYDPATKLLTGDSVGQATTLTLEASTDDVVSVADYGDDIQAALNDNAYGSTVRLENKTYTTGPITVPSGSTIIMDNGCVVQDDGTLTTFQRLINISGVQDVSIAGAGATVKMDRAVYTSGAQRHNVFIVASSNVSVSGLASNDSGGDGYYIGVGSSNITLTDVSADNNRRQGLSITGGRDITVTTSAFTNTNGELPGAGIDIEPNGNSDRLENILIDRPTTSGNAGTGIIISMTKLPGATARDVSITVNSHNDTGSKVGFELAPMNLGGNTVTGSITVNNPTWTSSKIATVLVQNYDSTAPLVTINNPTVTSPNTNVNSVPRYGSAFTIYREASQGGASSVGAVTINNPTIASGGNAVSYFHVVDLSGPAVENVNILGTITEGGLSDTRDFVDCRMVGSIDDTGGVITYDLTGDHTQNSSSYVKKFTNTAATGTHTVTLAGLTEIPVGTPEINFEVTSANTIAITGDGISKQSNDVGATLTIQREVAGWTVVTETGTWT